LKLNVLDGGKIAETFANSVGSSVVPLVGATFFLTLLNSNVDKQIAAEKDARKEQIVAIDKQIAAQIVAVDKQIAAQIAAEKDARKEQIAALEKCLKQAVDRIENVMKKSS
jgi:uncharacterized protein YllA (UPF0747 family)